MVSEIMLQQTQVQRVVPKYQAFLKEFPTITKLAEASLQEVLLAWSGLGYNRRAKFLHQAARIVAQDHDGLFPRTIEELVKLPGIGANTAAAIVTYSFNRPVIFIETNIRSVYLHHFFKDQINVHDKEILSLVEQTVDQDEPREWYWALMDYGSYLKSVLPNPSRASKHHIKQSTFEGSRRQVRGQVLRSLAASPKTQAVLSRQIADERLVEVLVQLSKEGLIRQEGKEFHLG